MNKVFLSLLIVVLAIGGLSANPFQSMGFLRVPDAYVLPHMALEGEYGNYVRREQSLVNAPFEYVACGSINAGLFDRVQIGFFGGDKVFYMNAKVRLIKETDAFPQVAIGIENVFSPIKENFMKQENVIEDYGPDAGYYEKNSPFVTFTKETMLPFKKIFGLPNMLSYATFGWGQHRFVGQDPQIRRLGGLFASLEVRPLPFLSFVGEMDGQNFNWGGKFTWRNFSAKLAYSGLEEKENMRYGLGIGYLWDGWVKPESKDLMGKDNRTMSREEAEKYVQELLAKEKAAMEEASTQTAQVYTKQEVDAIVQKSVQDVMEQQKATTDTAVVARYYTEDEVNQIAEEKARQMLLQQQQAPTDTATVVVEQPKLDPAQQLLLQELKDIKKQLDDQKKELAAEKAKQDSVMTAQNQGLSNPQDVVINPQQVTPQVVSGRTPIEVLLDELTKLRVERTKMQDEFKDLIKTLDKLEKETD